MDDEEEKDTMMRVFTYVPPESSEAELKQASVLVAMHGAKRDADNYFDGLLDSGEPQRLRTILLVPEISKELFPKRRGYNLINAFRAPDAVRQTDAGRPLPHMRPPEQWVSSAIERMFEVVRKALSG